jgi:hypothetical protein
LIREWSLLFHIFYDWNLNLMINLIITYINYHCHLLHNLITRLYEEFDLSWLRIETIGHGMEPVGFINHIVSFWMML